MSTSDIAVGLLERADPRLADELSRLVNDVYLTAEYGLWREGSARTTPSEMAQLIGAGEIAVATRDDRIVGSIRIHDVADDTSEFGILVASPDARGKGVGRALVDFAERRGRERGLRAMQLELLVPREGRHHSKEFLKSWYGRMGYRLIRTRSFDDAYPHLAPLLATPCDLTVYEKPLEGPSVGPARAPAVGAASPPRGSRRRRRS
jgi:GNAT superfamily N-acetyltransferase